MDDKKGKGFRLGELLVQKGYITWEQLEEVLRIQAQSGEAKDVITYKAKPANKVLNLGEVLIRHGWITWDQLSDALQTQKTSGRLLGDILLDKKFISKKDLYRGLAIQSDMAFVDFDKIQIPQETINLVPKRVALDLRVMPLVKKGSELLIATCEMKNTQLDATIFPQYQLHMALSTPEDIDNALKKYYGA